ncbi:MAG: cohesin domain-containing protein [Desulfobacterales bacterium]
MKNICLSLVSGFICLLSVSARAEPVISVPLDTAISPGTSVTFPVNLAETANAGIRGYSLRIVYDPAILSNPVAIRSGTLSESVPDGHFISIAWPYDGIGMYSVGAYGISFSQDCVLVNIRFDVSPDADANTANILFVSPNRKTSLFANGYDAIPSKFMPLQADIDGDGSISLKDSITGLQILSGLAPQHVQLLSDTDNDRCIGMSELLFVLEYLTENSLF